MDALKTTFAQKVISMIRSNEGAVLEKPEDFFNYWVSRKFPGIPVKSENRWKRHRVWNPFTEQEDSLTYKEACYQILLEICRQSGEPDIPFVTVNRWGTGFEEMPSKYRSTLEFCHRLWLLEEAAIATVTATAKKRQQQEQQQYV